MALIKCRECGKKVSLNASACPKCGEPPPTKEQLKQERVRGLKFWGIVIAILFFVFVSAAVKNSWDRSQAKAAKIARLENFNSNPEIILTEIRALAEQKKYDQALALAKPYEASQNTELLKVIQKIEPIHQQIKNQAEEKKLLAKVKRVPAKDFRTNTKYYSQLMDLNPNKLIYKQKYDYYRALWDKQEEKREQREKKSEQLALKFGRPPVVGPGLISGYNCPEIESYLQQTAHDPDSIELDKCTEVMRSKQGWLVGCVYRGRNGFGGKVRNANWFTIRHGQVVKVDPSETYSWK